jgi:possible transposase subunit B (fragment)
VAVQRESSTTIGAGTRLTTGYRYTTPVDATTPVEVETDFWKQNPPQVIIEIKANA